MNGTGSTATDVAHKLQIRSPVVHALHIHYPVLDIVPQKSNLIARDPQQNPARMANRKEWNAFTTGYWEGEPRPVVARKPAPLKHRGWWNAAGILFIVVVALAALTSMSPAEYVVLGYFCWLRHRSF